MNVQVPIPGQLGRAVVDGDWLPMDPCKNAKSKQKKHSRKAHTKLWKIIQVNKRCILGKHTSIAIRSEQMLLATI